MKKHISGLLAVVMAVSIIITTLPVYAADLKDTFFKISGTSFVYTGSEICPTITLAKKGVDSETGEEIMEPLVEGVDYSVTYSDNTKVGVGRITISGLGEYEDSDDVSTSFNIKPKKANRPTITASTTTSVSLSWQALPAEMGITGYKVYTCDANGANPKKVATTAKTAVTISKLTTGKKYNFIVRAYKELAKDVFLHGEYSDIRSYSTKPDKTTVTSVTNAKDKKSITVKWTKKTCSGYEVSYSTNNKFTSAKSVKVSGGATLSKTIKFDAKKKCYFRVRPYVVYESGKYNYGAWSSTSSNNFNKVYSKYSSNYVNNKDRTTNLKIASKAINGTVLQPGQTFSFNKVVGKRTSAKGYKNAYVFTGPSSHTLGIGGGVCQVASTMFNAALLGNFQIVERHQHSQRVTYVPLGRDAAIYWGSEDFKFKNNTSRPIKILMSVSNGKITCTIKVCEDVAPKKVNLKVTRSGNNFTLKRTVGGKVNYTTKSRY